MAVLGSPCSAYECLFWRYQTLRIQKPAAIYRQLRHSTAVALLPSSHLRPVQRRRVSTVRCNHSLGGTFMPLVPAPLIIRSIFVAVLLALTPDQTGNRTRADNFFEPGAGTSRSWPCDPESSCRTPVLPIGSSEINPDNARPDHAECCSSYGA
jgi:hypothetical protein